MNLPGRFNDHCVVIGLGGHFELIYDMTGATKAEVLAKEDEVILALRAKGVKVINPTNRELCQARGRATMAIRPKEQLRDFQKLGVAARWAKKLNGEQPHDS
jgi:hypothetical protein